MVKRTVLIMFILAAMAAGGQAGAHDDDTADPSKCDTWWRDQHGAGEDHDKYPSHHHAHSSDVKPGDPANTVVHGQSGHYVVRNDYGYVEVVGGQSYRGPDPDGNNFPGQGGYVQGEVDPGMGADGDFNVAFFGPNADALPAADPNAIQVWVAESYGLVCLDTAGQHFFQQTRDPED